MPDDMDFGRRLQSVEMIISELRGYSARTTNALESLARLEAHHTETRSGLGRAFGELEKHDARLDAIEADLPSFRLARRAVFAAIAMIVIAAATLVWDRVTDAIPLLKPPYHAPGER